ncbi:PadR family transcriptional regulator [Kytococcus sedentarius]|uniref:PadR family transcriptional regulator n=1 Tax=Kytococcus sedentarius TaxID=1276 RepID=UPI001950FBF7|nr:PadR family transcriptional regulator [Kytococcus sedentarius]QRO87668.1 PadR family transcriptional regulator [Kytococcus sedentarius]
MTQQRWPSEWMRGVLSLAVLRVLADGPTYGYAIASTLEESGLGAVKGGTLYPLLSRLEAAGHVTIEWRAGEGGPGRKYFALTDAGRDHLDREAAHWRAFTQTTSDFIDPRRDDA